MWNTRAIFDIKLGQIVNTKNRAGDGEGDKDVNNRKKDLSLDGAN
jgi:hypothetical protein